METETEFRDVYTLTAPASGTGKKTYEKAELRTYGDLKEVTGGGDPVS
jgi:hypothetical protein